MKIKKLEEENNKLKVELNKLKNNESNEIKKLKSDIDKYKNDLIKANKIISGLSNNPVDNNELKKLKDENTNLKLKLSEKDKEIIQLKNNSKNNTIEEQSFKYKDIIVINFMSMDGSVHYGVKCLPNDIFAEVEERLYKKYEDLRNTNNMFTANAKPVLRFKKLYENNIKDGDIIQLFKLE